MSLNIKEFLPQPRNIFKGFGAAFLFSVINPYLIYFVIIIIDLFRFEVQVPYMMYFLSIAISILLVSMVLSIIIGILFGRYSTYEKGSRKIFKNFALGFFIGVNFFGIIILRPNFLGIHLAVLAYIGCIRGEKWKARQTT